MILYNIENYGDIHEEAYKVFHSDVNYERDLDSILRNLFIIIKECFTSIKNISIINNYICSTNVLIQNFLIYF